MHQRTIIESLLTAIIQLCKHVVAKVALVPCSVKLTGKRDKVGHGEVTINNARIIPCLHMTPGTLLFQNSTHVANSIKC